MAVVKTGTKIKSPDYDGEYEVVRQFEKHSRVSHCDFKGFGNLRDPKPNERMPSWLASELIKLLNAED